MNDDILNLLNEIVELYELAQMMNERKKELLLTFTSSEPYAGYSLQAETYAKKLEEKEAILRELALKEYKKTGNKKPLAGTGIRIVRKVDYDETKAKEWAIKKSLTMLKLDKTRFESFAKEFPEDLEGIATVIEEPQVTITNREKLRQVIEKEIENEGNTSHQKA